MGNEIQVSYFYVCKEEARPIVEKVFESGDFVNAEAVKRKPGYFKKSYPVKVVKEGKGEVGEIELEVLVNGEA